MLKDTIDQRINCFKAIQSIPYKIDVAGKDATCLAKNKLLGELFSHLGLECRMIRGQSYWRDTPKIPADILGLAPKPTFTHIFLNVLIPETKKWVYVDATWDPALGPPLPISSWDGIHKTILACKVFNIENAGLPNEYPYRQFDPNDTFTKKLNEWYETLRGKNHE